MCVCIHIYMCVYMYIYMYIFIFIFIHIYIYVCVYIYLSKYIYIVALVARLLGGHVAVATPYRSDRCTHPSSTLRSEAETRRIY